LTVLFNNLNLTFHIKMVDAAAPKLSEEEMQMIYNWVDEIPLSRPKRNIARDFSDGGKKFMQKQHF
jgi:hypothetical protein